ncbi:MAG: DUF302 domain-containing protein [Oligoflexia bacterium]|nr:DUF302 domain-containing protein [Oligoflexia bacterium]
MAVNWKKEVALNTDAAIARLTQALQAEGFGILTRIDMHQKVKEKLGKEMPATVILGACNPGLAYEAAMINMDVTSLMPCNVVARDLGNGRTSVEFARATPILATLHDSKLDGIARQADEKLERAFKAI